LGRADATAASVASPRGSPYRTEGGHRVIAEEVNDHRVAKVGFLDKQTVGRARNDGEFSFGQRPVKSDPVFETNLIVIAQHHESPAPDRTQLIAGEGRLIPVHSSQLLDHDTVMRGTVR
jgi:hypothetical protein